MSNSVIGHGGAFSISNGDSPETFTSIDGVTSVEFGGSATDTLDDSAMGDSSLARTYIPGRTKAGDVTIKGWHKPGNTSQGKLVTARKSGAVTNFKYVYEGTAATETFAAIVVSYDKTITDDKQIEFTCKVTISGDITIS